MTSLSVIAVIWTNYAQTGDVLQSMAFLIRLETAEGLRPLLMLQLRLQIVISVIQNTLDSSFVFMYNNNCEDW